MNQSFYIGALGARNQQTKLNVVSNNIANVNTVGFKPEYSVFSDLVYTQTRNALEDVNVKTGNGSKVDEVKTNMAAMPYQTTGLENDYAVQGDGFFMLKDPVSGDITYTRDGRFQLAKTTDKFYLVNVDGKRVLNMDQEEISYDVKPTSYPSEEPEEEEEPEELQEGEHDPHAIGVYTFANTNGMQPIGDNVFAATAQNGDPILLEKAKVVSGSLEQSGTDFALEMTRMMEAQRAYSYALKMVQTSDEVESTINSLR
ncbi:flagellar hook-basal body protein [Clostridium boliviensis]|uniref:Flagellar hook-basal body protein n=1 Tax=Clostridium boliviensis TaxID=318465 RepID=A0ABU4GKI6_9CLOT|nr:flagellar hook-basal body protein [Clostridium boliviensis]MDW2798126.1 flagellar hook-basal body protein [Clostridium boliviensis]